MLYIEELETIKHIARMLLKSLNFIPPRFAQLSIALYIILFGGLVQADDFRDASWGMTLNDIVALHPEQIPADRRIGAIAFDGKLAALDVLIFYRFDERGQLFQAGYEVITADFAPGEIINHYNTLNGLLRRKYPQSEEPQQIWRNRLFEDDPDKWGQAVRSGHMSYEWRFTTPQTRIEHTLSKGRRELVHTLLYEAAAEETNQDVLEQL